MSNLGLLFTVLVIGFSQYSLANCDLLGIPNTPEADILTSKGYRVSAIPAELSTATSYSEALKHLPNGKTTMMEIDLGDYRMLEVIENQNGKFVLAALVDGPEDKLTLFSKLPACK